MPYSIRPSPPERGEVPEFDEWADDDAGHWFTEEILAELRRDWEQSAGEAFTEEEWEKELADHKREFRRTLWPQWVRRLPDFPGLAEDESARFAWNQLEEAEALVQELKAERDFYADRTMRLESQYAIAGKLAPCPRCGSFQTVAVCERCG